MLDNTRGKPFRCDQCDYTSNRSFDLRRHKQRHTRTRPAEGTVFKCSECAFVTKWKRNMGRHMQKHRRSAASDDSQNVEQEQTIEEFIVEVIDATEEDFEEDAVETAESTLTMILPTEELQKRFKCDLCRYTSNRAFDLRRHEQTHYRLKVVDGIAYKCSQCNFITKWKRNMRRHMRKHEEPAEQEFEPQTEQPTTEEFMLEILKSETDADVDTDGPYNERTDYSETQSSSQDFTPAEEYVINGEKRYKCNQCQYESKRCFDLRRHAQVHTKRKPIQGIAYQCNDCLFITKWKRNMRRHMEKHKRSPVAPVKQDEEDEEDYEEYVVELKSETDSQSDKIKDVNEEEQEQEQDNPEVLPSYWIALPTNET